VSFRSKSGSPKRQKEGAQVKEDQRRKPSPDDQRESSGRRPAKKQTSELASEDGESDVSFRSKSGSPKRQKEGAQAKENQRRKPSPDDQRASSGRRPAKKQTSELASEDGESDVSFRSKSGSPKRQKEGAQAKEDRGRKPSSDDQRESSGRRPAQKQGSEMASEDEETNVSTPRRPKQTSKAGQRAQKTSDAEPEKPSSRRPGKRQTSELPSEEEAASDVSAPRRPTETAKTSDAEPEKPSSRRPGKRQTSELPSEDEAAASDVSTPRRPKEAAKASKAGQRGQKTPDAEPEKPSSRRPGKRQTSELPSEEEAASDVSAPRRPKETAKAGQRGQKTSDAEPEKPSSRRPGKRQTSELPSEDEAAASDVSTPRRPKEAAKASKAGQRGQKTPDAEPEKPSSRRPGKRQTSELPSEEEAAASDVSAPRRPKETAKASKASQRAQKTSDAEPEKPSSRRPGKRTAEPPSEEEAAASDVSTPRRPKETAKASKASQRGQKTSDAEPEKSSSRRPGKRTAEPPSEEEAAASDVSTPRRPKETAKASKASQRGQKTSDAEPEKSSSRRQRTPRRPKETAKASKASQRGQKTSDAEPEKSSSRRQRPKETGKLSKAGQRGQKTSDAKPEKSSSRRLADKLAEKQTSGPSEDDALAASDVQVAKVDRRPLPRNQTQAPRGVSPRRSEEVQEPGRSPGRQQAARKDASPLGQKLSTKASGPTLATTRRSFQRSKLGVQPGGSQVETRGKSPFAQPRTQGMLQSSTQAAHRPSINHRQERAPHLPGGPQSSLKAASSTKSLVHPRGAASPSLRGLGRAQHSCPASCQQTTPRPSTTPLSTTSPPPLRRIVGTAPAQSRGQTTGGLTGVMRAPLQMRAVRLESGRVHNLADITLEFRAARLTWRGDEDKPKLEAPSESAAWQQMRRLQQLQEQLLRPAQPDMPLDALEQEADDEVRDPMANLKQLAQEAQGYPDQPEQNRDAYPAHLKSGRAEHPEDIRDAEHSRQASRQQSGQPFPNERGGRGPVLADSQDSRHVELQHADPLAVPRLLEPSTIREGGAKAEAALQVPFAAYPRSRELAEQRRLLEDRKTAAAHNSQAQKQGQVQQAMAQNLQRQLQMRALQQQQQQLIESQSQSQSRRQQAKVQSHQPSQQPTRQQVQQLSQSHPQMHGNELGPQIQQHSQQRGRLASPQRGQQQDKQHGQQRSQHLSQQRSQQQNRPLSQQRGQLSPRSQQQGLQSQRSQKSQQQGHQQSRQLSQQRGQQESRELSRQPSPQQSKAQQQSPHSQQQHRALSQQRGQVPGHHLGLQRGQNQSQQSGGRQTAESRVRSASPALRGSAGARQGPPAGKEGRSFSPRTGVSQTERGAGSSAHGRSMQPSFHSQDIRVRDVSPPRLRKPAVPATRRVKDVKAKSMASLASFLPRAQMTRTPSPDHSRSVTFGFADKVTALQPDKDQREGKDENLYVGFRNGHGQRDGFGVMQVKNGPTYTGQWSGSKREGHGTLFFDGGVFEGQWTAGNAHGKGAVHFKNGDTFQGNYANNKKCGHGVYKWADGTVESGDYLEGQKHGTHLWCKGSDAWQMTYDKGTLVATQRASDTETKADTKEFVSQKLVLDKERPTPRPTPPPSPPKSEKAREAANRCRSDSAFRAQGFTDAEIALIERKSPPSSPAPLPDRAFLPMSGRASGLDANRHESKSRQLQSCLKRPKACLPLEKRPGSKCFASNNPLRLPDKEQNPFDLFGVKRGTEKAEIRKIFRKRVQTEHPDVSSDPEAGERFQELVAAYNSIMGDELLPDELNYVRVQMTPRYKKTLEADQSVNNGIFYALLPGMAVTLLGIGFVGLDTFGHLLQNNLLMQREEDANGFLQKCFAKPERMRLLCSTKAEREGGDSLAVAVEIAPGGPVVEVQEVSMADGWTGCRFSPSSLWLALSIGQNSLKQVERPSAIEFGCGVALAGLAAHAVGYDTTLTDCLPGHLANLTAHATRLRRTPSLEVFCLDWIADVGKNACDIDTGSPENLAALENGKPSGPSWQSIPQEKLRSFDLALASDVVYEPHHAVLLPLVIERWLKPGGWLAVSLAIRDEAICCRFLEQLDACGLLSYTEHLLIETACVPERRLVQL
ncbi:unnamed protein product, partial [Effrenium voratum]